jgi:hypothetical protein
LLYVMFKGPAIRRNGLLVISRYYSLPRAGSAYL